jgi:hypothetical protein
MVLSREGWPDVVFAFHDVPNLEGGCALFQRS